MDLYLLSYLKNKKIQKPDEQEKEENCTLSDLVTNQNHFSSVYISENLVFGLSNAKLSHCKLSNIKGIETFKTLQKIDLSHNNIKEVTKSICELKDLSSLNISFNMLKKINNFLSEVNLLHIDLSHNKLENFPDIAEFKNLQTLNISYNLLNYIQNSTKNHSLNKLNISHNPLKGLDELGYFENIQEINTNNCEFESLIFLDSFRNASYVYMNRCSVKNMDYFKNFNNIIEIDLSYNLIFNITQLQSLIDNKFLEKIDLSGNKCQKTPFYTYQIIKLFPSVLEIDGHSVLATQKYETNEFYGDYLNDKKKLFKEILSEENFMDYRFHTSSDIDKFGEYSNEQDNELIGI